MSKILKIVLAVAAVAGTAAETAWAGGTDPVWVKVAAAVACRRGAVGREHGPLDLQAM